MAMQNVKQWQHEERVNHPQHYGGENNPYEVIKVIEAWGLGFSLGNTLKYIYRSGRKDPAKHLEDLKKARWYLDREIKRCSGELDGFKGEDVRDSDGAHAAHR